MNHTISCLQCERKATWVRYTQFAGDRPYCYDHAIEEGDFDEDDSYEYWVEDQAGFLDIGGRLLPVRLK